jgi:hypothetical protein
MAAIRKSSTYARAEAVLAVMETLIDTDEKEDLFVCGYGPGLHIQLWSGERRCNVAGYGGGDGLVLMVGGNDDFDADTHRAKDSASVFIYGHDDFYRIAQAALAFLHKGTIMKNGAR